MSGKIMGAVFSLRLPKPEREVLLALADHAHDDGSGARPGVGLLSWKVDLSPRQVKRLLRRLEERGLIVAVAHRSGGRNRATEYRISLDCGERKPAYRSRSNSDILASPFTDKKSDTSDAETVTPNVENGDIPERKGDTDLSPQPLEPSKIRTAKCMSRPRARARPTEIPLDFCPSPESIAWAREHCLQLNPEPQTRRFVLFFQGTGRRCVDWDARWRLWMIDSAERQGGGSGQRFLSSAERSEERLRSRDYKADGEEIAARIEARRASGRSRFDPGD